MGARGPGASRMRKAAEEAEECGPHTWEAANLSRAERVILFIESMPITKGYGAGEPVKQRVPLKTIQVVVRQPSA